MSRRECALTTRESVLGVRADEVSGRCPRSTLSLSLFLFFEQQMERPMKGGGRGVQQQCILLPACLPACPPSCGRVSHRLSRARAALSQPRGRRFKLKGCFACLWTAAAFLPPSLRAPGLRPHLLALAPPLAHRRQEKSTGPATTFLFAMASSGISKQRVAILLEYIIKVYIILL